MLSNLQKSSAACVARFCHILMGVLCSLCVQVVSLSIGCCVKSWQGRATVIVCCMQSCGFLTLTWFGVQTLDCNATLAIFYLYLIAVRCVQSGQKVVSC